MWGRLDAIQQWKASEGLITGCDKIGVVILEVWTVGSRGAQR